MVYVWSLKPQTSALFSHLQPQTFSSPSPSITADMETVRQPQSLARSSRLIEDINDNNKNVDQDIIVQYEKKKENKLQVQVPASTSLIVEVPKTKLVGGDFHNFTVAQTVTKSSTTSPAMPGDVADITPVPSSTTSRLSTSTPRLSLARQNNQNQSPFRDHVILSLKKSLSQTPQPKKQYNRPRPVYIHKIQKPIRDDTSTTTTTSTPSTTTISFEAIFPNILNPTTPIVIEYTGKKISSRPTPSRTPRLQVKTEKLVAESKGSSVTLGHLILVCFMIVNLMLN